MMEAYLKDELSAAERFAVERYLLDHPFEAEAMAGWEKSDLDMSKELTELKSRLPKDEKKTIGLWRKPLGIAATIALLFVTSLTLWVVLDEVRQSDEVVVKESAMEEEEPAKTEFLEEEISVETKDMDSPVVEEIKEPEPKIQEPKPAEVTEPVIRERVVIEEEKEEAQEQVLQELEGQVAGLEMQEEEAFVMADESVTEEGSLEPVAVASVARAKKMQAASSAAVERSAGYAGPKNVTGQVVDAAGEPIIGATVVVKGTTKGTTTGLDGEFELVVEPDEVLSISFIGYNTQEVSAVGFDTLTVRMEENFAALEEVVIVGYGVQEKRDVTGSIALVEEDRNVIPQEGFAAYKDYVKENLIYPRPALDAQIEGRVVVQFLVSADGSLSDFTIKKSLGYGCDEEAIRLIKEGPSWNPSMRERQNVSEEVTLRIRFKLPED